MTSSEDIGALTWSLDGQYFVSGATYVILTEMQNQTIAYYKIISPFVFARVKSMNWSPTSDSIAIAEAASDFAEIWYMHLNH